MSWLSPLEGQEDVVRGTHGLAYRGKAIRVWRVRVGNVTTDVHVRESVVGDL